MYLKIPVILFDKHPLNGCREDVKNDGNDELRQTKKDGKTSTGSKLKKALTVTIVKIPVILR